MTGDVSLVAVLQSLGAQAAAFLALLLGAAAVHKAAHFSRSRRVVREFGGIPGPLAGAALGVALVGELCAGVSMLLPTSREAGAVLAAAIWAGYLLLLLRAILQNRRDVDCGCSFGPAHRPLGAFQVIRNATLVVASAGVAASAGIAAVSAGPPPPVAASQLLGAGALLALYGALDQVMAQTSLRAGESA